MVAWNFELEIIMGTMVCLLFQQCTRWVACLKHERMLHAMNAKIAFISTHTHTFMAHSPLLRTFGSEILPSKVGGFFFFFPFFPPLPTMQHRWHVYLLFDCLSWKRLETIACMLEVHVKQMRNAWTFNQLIWRKVYGLFQYFI